jgi:tripartite-type tricarboxylate transporter receptor subunit TctC
MAVAIHFNRQSAAQTHRGRNRREGTRAVRFWNRVCCFVVVVAGIVIATLHSLSGATLQAYPLRPITIVVPFPPGGSPDIVARVLAEDMQTSLGQPVIIQNIPGANGSLGVGRVARAAADGYTLVMGAWNTHVANGATYVLQYDVANDFTPILLAATFKNLIVVRKSLPADDLQGLLAWLRANPDKASQGSAGMGSAGHIAGLLFQKLAGTHFQHVPYRGGAPAVQDLVAGRIDLMIEQTLTVLPQVRAGTIKAFAVTGNSRLAVAPEIPTVDEAGLKGFYVSNWSALFAPKGTPKDIIDRLNAAGGHALAVPSVRSRLADLGLDIPSANEQMPEALGALQKGEIEKWWPIIRAAGVMAE